MEIKSICKIENEKKQYNVKSNLVKIGCVSVEENPSNWDYEVRMIIKYLNNDDMDLNSIISLFNNSIKNDISKDNYMVSYLDTLMDERYVEDSEVLYGYFCLEYKCPLAIRGTRKETIKFIKMLLCEANTSEKDLGDYKNTIPKSVTRSNINKIVCEKFGGDIHKLIDYVISNLDFSELKENFSIESIEAFEDGGDFIPIDKAYYEQRGYNCPV